MNTDVWIDPVVQKRIDNLKQHFDGYLREYEARPPFTPEQWRPHARTIAMRRQLGSANAALGSDEFVSSLYDTLLAWDLGKRGSILVPRAQFPAGLRAHVDAIVRLDGIALDDPALKAACVQEQVYELICDLGVCMNKAKLVAGTKTLHHLLPDLVPPLDRKYVLEGVPWTTREAEPESAGVSIPSRVCGSAGSVRGETEAICRT